jgi:hypothetical protein
MSLINCEITMVPGPAGPAGATAMVVADVPAPTAAALADAVAHHRNGMALGEIDSDQAIRVRRAGDLVDRLRPAPDTTMAVLRLDSDDLGVVCDALERYLAERDVDSYQPPEERERLGALREARDGLRDAQARLMLAGLSTPDEAVA